MTTKQYLDSLSIENHRVDERFRPVAHWISFRRGDRVIELDQLPDYGYGLDLEIVGHHAHDARDGRAVVRVVR